MARIRELVRKYPRFGYRRIWALLVAEGWSVNVKRVYRLWRKEGLKVPRRSRKKRALGSGGNACDRTPAEHRNHTWCWDFVFHRTCSGTTLKWLSVVDEYTRECLVLRVGRSCTAQDVLDALAELFATHAVPKFIRSDNGPEFIAQAIRDWLTATGIGTRYVDPASPWQNGYAESFHSRLRDEFLNTEEFADLREAQIRTQAWQADYNHQRPHSALKYQTPAAFAAVCGNSGRATPSLRRRTQRRGRTTPVSHP
jgi:transposase InsO family protein